MTDDFEMDSCPCLICVNERLADADLAPSDFASYNAELASDESLPTDAEVSAILDTIFATAAKVDAPEDVDALFAQVFNSIDEDKEAYPFGPVFFTEDELGTISSALRFKGEFLCKQVAKIVNPDNAWTNEETISIIETALDENDELIALHSWIDDEFGISG